MTSLLDPNEAISGLKALAIKLIDEHQELVASFARLEYRRLPRQERESRTREEIESALYLGNRYDVPTLVHWLNELAEATFKALKRGDDLATLDATSAIAHVAGHYLKVRKDNIVLTYASPHTSGSDAFDILEPAIINLKEVVIRATADKRERVATAAIRSLTYLTASTALGGKPFKDKAGAIAWLPLGYLTDSIKLAQEGGLAEAAFEGSKSLLKLASGLKPTVGIAEAHLSIVTALRDITHRFLLADKGAVARETVKHLMQLNWVLLEQDHYQLEYCLAESLSALKALAPIVFLQEKGQPFALTNLPVAAAYELTEPSSLPYFVAKAAARVKRDADRDWVNPYSDFIRLNEVISRHLRELAETPGCGDSALMWHIGRMVGHIANVYSFLLRKSPPDTEVEDHRSELVGGTFWYVDTLSRAFDKTPPASLRWADDVTEQLASIGMSLCAAGFPEVAGVCGSHIRSIAQSCYPKARFPHDIADLLMGIWKLRLFAELQGHIKIVSALDKKLERLPEIKEDQWHVFEEALALRKKQFEEDLDRGDRVSLSMSEPAMLIFRERQRAKTPPETPGSRQSAARGELDDP